QHLEYSKLHCMMFTWNMASPKRSVANCADDDLLRACLKRSRSSQSAQHQTSHSDVNHRFAAAWQDFIILAQTPTLGQPGEGALNDPASGKNHEAFLPIAAQHGLQDEAVVKHDPLQ